MMTASLEAKGTVDPVIQHLLKNARSEAVRQEFLRMSSDEYTSKHDVNVLVSLPFLSYSSAHCAAQRQ